LISEFLKTRVTTGSPGAVTDVELTNELRRVQWHHHIFNELQANLIQNWANSQSIAELWFLHELVSDNGAVGRVEFAKRHASGLSEDDEALLIEMRVKGFFGGSNQLDVRRPPDPPPNGRPLTRTQLLKETTGAVQLALMTIGSGASDEAVQERLGLFSQQLVGRNHNPLCFSYDFRDELNRSLYYQNDDDQYETVVRHDDLAAELRRGVFRACYDALARPGAADDAIVAWDYAESSALVADVHAAVLDSDDLGTHALGTGEASIAGAFALYEAARVRLGMSKEIRNDATMLNLRERMAATGRMPPIVEPLGSTLFGRASRLQQLSIRDDSHAGRLVQRLALVCKAVLAALISRGLAGLESRPFLLRVFPSPDNLFVNDDGGTTEEDDSPVRKLPLGERVDGALHDSERVLARADALEQAGRMLDGETYEDAVGVLDRVEALLAASYAMPRRGELEAAKGALLVLI